MKPSRSQDDLFGHPRQPAPRADEPVRADGTRGERRRGTGDRRASASHNTGPARGDRRSPAVSPREAP